MIFGLVIASLATLMGRANSPAAATLSRSGAASDEHVRRINLTLQFQETYP